MLNFVDHEDRVLFGKHKGEALDRVPSPYLRWLYEQAGRKLKDYSRDRIMVELESRGHAPVRVRSIRTTFFKDGRWVSEVTIRWRDEWGVSGTGEYPQ